MIRDFIFPPIVKRLENTPKIYLLTNYIVLHFFEKVLEFDEKVPNISSSAWLLKYCCCAADHRGSMQQTDSPFYVISSKFLTTSGPIFEDFSDWIPVFNDGVG